jgi:hypothetical protein
MLKKKKFFTIFFFFSQALQYVLTGKFPLTEDLAKTLAALQLQALIGDYTSDETISL